MAGLLGVSPRRKFKIYREEFPAIFRFDGVLYQEDYDIDHDDTRWVEISERIADHWLRAKTPEVSDGKEADRESGSVQQTAGDDEA